MTYLGLDVGTSAVKAVLIGPDGAVLAAAESSPLDVSRPAPGHSEQDPDAWIAACEEAVRGLGARHEAGVAAIEAIGLSGQMHGATLLDANDRPLRPAILWNDGRSGAECEAMDAAEPGYREIGGNLVMPGFTAPKLEWVRKHEPDVFAATATVLLPKDYVRLHLTGEHASDVSDASGTLWLDVAARAWSERLLSASKLTPDHMPRLVEGTEVSGRLRRDVAAKLGIKGAPVVAGGGGDNAASACGVGAIKPGTAFVSLGTSGVLFATTDRYRPNTAGAVHAMCHAVPNTWHQMAVILSAAGSLAWLAEVLQAPARDLAALVEAAGRRGPGDLLFLPYLSGERTPHNDPAVRGAFVGLGHESDRAAMTRAVLTGVAFAFKDGLDALRAAGTRVERATAVGGGARSSAWLEILADATGLSIDVPEDGEFGGAYGAARLGLIAAEGADPVSVCTAPPMRAMIEPRADLAEAYAKAQARYRGLYPAVK